MKIGIDLGGTKIEGVALNKSGEELFRERIPTPHDSYSQVLQAIRGLVQTAVARTGISDYTVGVGTPGAVSPASGLIKNANSTCLIGHPMLEDLKQVLECPVRIANDANCFVLSEGTDGAANEGNVVFGVIIGTGVGGGVLVDKKLLVGTHAIAGEWGHNPLPWPNDDERPGPTCYCGKQGCIEAFLCGKGIQLDHQNYFGEVLEPEEIASRADQGDSRCEETMQRYEDRMARALATVINLIDPDMIVFGGGLSNIERLYKNVPLHLPKYVFSDEVHTRLVQNRHGDSSGVRGAAWLFE